MEGSKTRLKVLCPVVNPRTQKTYWVKMGRAHINRDGSTNVYLDALPTNGQLHIREDDDEHRPPRPEGPAQDQMPF